MVGAKTAKWGANPESSGKHNIVVTLPRPALSQGNDIRQNDSHEGRLASASDSGKGSGCDELIHGCGESAE